MQRLSEHVYLIEGENKGKYPSCNCLFIKDDRSCLIDAGARDVKEVKPDLILNSHWHEDHIVYNCIHDAKIGAHVLDAEAVESYEEFKKRYGLPGDLVKVFINFEFRKVDFRFEDDDEYDLGRAKIKVIHTPGHSAGHCCFLVDDNVKMLYLADIDLTSFGPWYGCLDCNINDFVESIKKMTEIVEREDIEIAVPSHKGVVVGREKIKMYLQSYMGKIFERDKKILDMLRKGLKREDLIGKGIIYRKFPEPVKIYEHFEKIMIEKHLERLK